jgi:hypothetical protein
MRSSIPQGAKIRKALISGYGGKGQESQEGQVSQEGQNGQEGAALRCTEPAEVSLSKGQESDALSLSKRQEGAALRCSELAEVSGINGFVFWK